MLPAGCFPDGRAHVIIIPQDGYNKWFAQLSRGETLSPQVPAQDACQVIAVAFLGEIFDFDMQRSVFDAWTMITGLAIDAFVKVFTDILRIEPDIKRGVQPTIGKTEPIIGFNRLPDQLGPRAHRFVGIYGQVDHSTSSRSILARASHPAGIAGRSVGGLMPCPLGSLRLLPALLSALPKIASPP
jgi:hypothetical protein